MEMVAVGGVVFRAEHGAEAFAGAGLDQAQELAFIGGAGSPIAQHGDPAAIGQDEAGDINRIAAGMGAAVVGAGDIAAIIAAHCFNAHQWAAQYLSRCTVHTKARPAREC